MQRREKKRERRGIEHIGIRSRIIFVAVTGSTVGDRMKIDRRRRRKKISIFVAVELLLVVWQLYHVVRDVHVVVVSVHCDFFRKRVVVHIVAVSVHRDVVRKMMLVLVVVLVVVVVSVHRDVVHKMVPN